MPGSNAADEDWDLLLSFFPSDWMTLARRSSALKGLRQDKSAENLLRVLLLHLGCGYSMRETVVRAKEANSRPLGCGLAQAIAQEQGLVVPTLLWPLCRARLPECGVGPANVASGRFDCCARTRQDRRSVAHPL